MMTDTLCPDAFVNNLASLNLPARVLLAVSGGRDSMVLASLCAKITKDVGSTQIGLEGTTFIAVTVDHGLRVGAAREANHVGELCKGFGIEHHILTRDASLKIETAIQEEARNARYALLVRAAYEFDCDAIITAHTQTDLAETVMMRLARGSGMVGLAGMRRERMVAAGAGYPVRLIRPMLDISREAITNFADENAIAYVDDPSNQNDVFERVRYRALLVALDQQSLLTEKAIAQTAGRCARAYAHHMDQVTQYFVDAGGIFHGWGAIEFDRKRVDSKGHAPMFSRALYAAGGAEHPPDEEAARSTIRKALETGAATQSGAMVIVDQTRLIIMREPAALFGRGRRDEAPISITLGPGEKGLWDRRFIFENVRSEGMFIVAPRPANMPLPTAFSGAKRCADGLATVSAVPIDEHSSHEYALPGRLPEGCRMASLLPERFNANVVRYP